MNPLPYWANRDYLVDPINALSTLYSSSLTNKNRPLFFLSNDPVEKVVERLQAQAYHGTAVHNMSQAHNNFAPSTAQINPESVGVSEQGMLQVVWPAENDEVLFPVIDMLAQNGTGGTPLSFGLLVSDAPQRKVTGSSYYAQYFDPPVNLWAAGTVGDYQSGADLEFEALSRWKLGRPLYLKGNALELPLRLMR